MTRLRQQEIVLGQQISGLTSEYKKLVSIIYHYEECVYDHVKANEEALKEAELARAKAEAAAKALAKLNQTNNTEASSADASKS